MPPVGFLIDPQRGYLEGTAPAALARHHRDGAVIEAGRVDAKTCRLAQLHHRLWPQGGGDVDVVDRLAQQAVAYSTPRYPRRTLSFQHLEHLLQRRGMQPWRVRQVRR